MFFRKALANCWLLCEAKKSKKERNVSSEIEGNRHMKSSNPHPNHLNTSRANFDPVKQLWDVRKASNSSEKRKRENKILRIVLVFINQKKVITK